MAAATAKDAKLGGWVPGQVQVTPVLGPGQHRHGRMRVVAAPLQQVPHGGPMLERVGGDGCCHAAAAARARGAKERNNPCLQTPIAAAFEISLHCLCDAKMSQTFASE